MAALAAIMETLKSDIVAFMGGTAVGRSSDTWRALQHAQNSGRDVVAITMGEHRPDGIIGANHLLERCDHWLFTDCYGAEFDADSYAAELFALAEASPTGHIDILAHSYSTFEVSIVFEKYPELKNVVDSVLLLAPTRVRDDAFDGVNVVVVFEEDDMVRLAPFDPLNVVDNPLGIHRLHPAAGIAGASVETIDINVGTWNPVRQVDIQHDGWHRDEDMIGFLGSLLEGL